MNLWRWIGSTLIDHPSWVITAIEKTEWDLKTTIIGYSNIYHDSPVRDYYHTNLQISASILYCKIGQRCYGHWTDLVMYI